MAERSTFSRTQTTKAHTKRRKQNKTKSIRTVTTVFRFALISTSKYADEKNIKIMPVFHKFVMFFGGRKEEEIKKDNRIAFGLRIHSNLQKIKKNVVYYDKTQHANFRCTLSQSLRQVDL